MLKLMKVLALVLFAAALALPMWMPSSVEGQAGTEALTTDMDAKTPNDLFNGFGALGTPIDECVADPVASNRARQRQVRRQQVHIQRAGNRRGWTWTHL